ncbi:unnamed protein product [Gongylonema pulchrum]|uniref:Uncharacterized protein n=1 Tax=Gongylonema pulchrum TaxID=637853 RepID=A0A3P7RQV7_9BILA|nr:unnamed protein product [Gongylonema pulchrum]
MIDNPGYIKKRSKSKVIRYRMYNIHTEPQQFYRELLMLYYRWRNEEAEIVNIDCEVLFHIRSDEIMQNRGKYHYFPNSVVEDAMEQAQNDAQAREASVDTDPIAPTFDFNNDYRVGPEVIHIEDGQYSKCGTCPMRF